jgi:hypothetical protein
MVDRYFVNIEPREPSGVVLTIDALPRLLVFGDTPEDALRRAREAVGFELRACRQNGEPEAVELVLRGDPAAVV